MENAYDMLDVTEEPAAPAKIIRNRKTKFVDRNGDPIYLGDIIHVEEFPGRYVGGALDYEGVVELDDDGDVVVGYYDIGEDHDATELRHFPVEGRELYTEKEQYKYWRSALLGGEPEEKLWKRDVYRNMPYEV